MTPTEMLARLVAFPTVSRDGNRALAVWARDWLATQGVAATLQPDASGRQANLWATIGPAVPGGVVLSGHTDVVPVDGQAWTSDPYRLVERDGRLYGRGACDMKGFVALCLALAPEMREAGLRRPIHLALSYDEEVGYGGARRMAPAMAEVIPPPAAVLVGEPTGMRVVTQHKGGLGMTTTVRGHEVHSSILHRGVSAIDVAARLIDWHRAAMAAEAAAADSDCPFDPPYTTFHVGVIEGGTAANITAGRCRFVSDIRPLPEQSPEDWLARYLAAVAEVEAGIRAVHPACAVEVDARFIGAPCRPEPGGAAEALARGLTGDNGATVVSYGTEAGIFQALGWSTVVVGPGDIAQAHQPDEYIERAQFEAGEAFLRRLIARLAA